MKESLIYMAHITGQLLSAALLSHGTWMTSTHPLGHTGPAMGTLSVSLVSWPGSSVGVATDYRLDSLGSNPGRDEIFRPFRPALGPTQPPAKLVPGFSPGVKCGRGVLLTTHALLVPRSWKSKAIPLPTLWATPGL